MAFLSFLLVGGCSFNETLTVSGNGSFTFCYQDPYLYVTDEGASSNSILLIYDMSNTASPVLKSTTSLPNGSGAREPRVFNGKLFIPYRTSRHLAIWNIDDPSAPTLTGSVSLPDFSPGGPNGVAVIGTKALVGCSSFTATTTLQRIDISDPSAPVVDASLRPYNIAIQSTMAFGGAIVVGSNFVVTGVVTGGSSTPYVATVNPTTFAATDIITYGVSGGSASEIVSDGGSYVYTYNGNEAKINTVNVSDPANIVLESNVTPSSGGGSGAAHRLVCIPEIDRLYFGKAGGTGLQIYIFDISTRSTPVEVGTISTSGETVTCMGELNGSSCAGFAWAQGTGASIHLIGTPPTS